jgi:predicted ester cyclase
MSLAANKAVVRRLYEEVFTAGDLAAADDLLAAEYAGYDPPDAPEAVRGPGALKRVAERMAAAFPDRRFALDALIAEADMVAARVTLAATHTGQFLNAAPTGRRVAITGTVTCQLAGGRIVASWGNWDNLGLLRQLGLVSV